MDLDISIAKMRFSDIQEVVRISISNPNGYFQFKEVHDKLSQPERYEAITARVTDNVVGYATCIRDSSPTGVVHLESISVTPELRRCKIGTALMTSLIQRTKAKDYRAMVAGISEINLIGQLFLRSQKFICRGTLHSEDDPDADQIYVMTREFVDDDSQLALPHYAPEQV